MKALRKGLRIVVVRIKTQGVPTTALWAYARGIPYITGIPMLSYSRITPSLFVGCQYRRIGKWWMVRAGITHIVNMRSEFDDAAHDLTLDGSTYSQDTYCHLPTPDDDAPSLAHIAKGVEFIHSAVSGGGKVYIHCSAGVGRAPTMAVAYLMSCGYDLCEAIGMVRKARAFVNMTQPQMGLLQGLDKAYIDRRDGTERRSQTDEERQSASITHI